MKKILLTLAMALVTVYASAYFKVGDIYYQPDEQADDGTCWVRDSPYYGGYDGLTDITIPGRVTYNGREYRVTSIGSEAFKNVTTLSVCAWVGAWRRSAPRPLPAVPTCGMSFCPAR